MHILLSRSFRRLVPCSLLLSLSLCAQNPQAGPELTPAPIPKGAPEAMALVDQRDLSRHAHYLASDALGGRYTGSSGQEKAAEYIADHFKSLGLLPLGSKKKSYIQYFPLERTTLVEKKSYISVGSKKHARGYAVIPGKDKKVSLSSFVFCGYGATAGMPKGLKGKIPVVILRKGADRQLNKAYAISREIDKRGGKAALFCVLDDDNGVGDRLNTSGLLPDKPQVSYPGKGRGRLAKPARIPLVFVCKELSLEILKALGCKQDNTGDYEQTKKKRRASGKLKLEIKFEAKYQAQNVCAYLPGTSKSKEAVVFSAHMDHMGTRMDGNAFNGADDNASGSAALLDVAEAFAKGEPPARSVVFLSVCGEEEGLWGSAYYADHPTWPSKRIVADINIDMIGRLGDISDENQISVTPHFQHQMYSTVGQDASKLAAQLGLSLTNGDKYYARSDHYNFAKKGIPVVFFCDGEHSDYHKVTDTPDKLDYAKMERVARLAYWTGLGIAEAKSRPKVLGKQKDW